MCMVWCYFLYLFLYGWIAGDCNLRNYRHFVSQCPVSTLEWLPNFPHKAWVDPDEGSFTCQVNHREWESNRYRLCSNRSPWPLNHGAYSIMNSICSHGFFSYIWPWFNPAFQKVVQLKGLVAPDDLKIVPEEMSLKFFAKSEICHKMSLHWSSESKYQALQRHLKFKGCKKKNFVNLEFRS